MAGKASVFSPRPIICLFLFSLHSKAQLLSIVRPQALEWIPSDACGFPFQVSIDNLNGPPIDIVAYREAIVREKQHMLAKGLSKRTQTLYCALSAFYHAFI